MLSYKIMLSLVLPLYGRTPVQLHVLTRVHVNLCVASHWLTVLMVQCTATGMWGHGPPLKNEVYCSPKIHTN
jgi:hypothetical protein